jgi:hypothetical protein
MWGLRYLAAFAVGTVVGVLNEYAQKPQQPCYRQPTYSHLLTCGVANVYGWSTLVLTAYFDFMVKLKAPTVLILLAISPVLTVLEALMGLTSKWYFKEQRWKYPASYYPACGGTVSLVSGIYFAAIGVLYWYVLYKPLMSKL